MAQQTHSSRNRFRNGKRKFVIFVAISLIISTKVNSARAKNAGDVDQPGTFEDELPSATDDDEDDLQFSSGTGKEDDDVIEDNSDWMMLVPYMPVVILIALMCWCHGSCGDKRTERIHFPETTANNVEEPVYSTSPPDYWSVVNQPPNQTANVWTVQGHIAIMIPEYEITEEKEEKEEEPPAYDTLFQVKQVKDEIISVKE